MYKRKEKTNDSGQKNPFPFSLSGLNDNTRLSINIPSRRILVLLLDRDTS